MAAQGLAVLQLLYRLQTAADPTFAGEVVGVERYAHTGIHTAVDVAGIDDRVLTNIHDRHRILVSGSEYPVSLALCPEGFPVRTNTVPVIDRAFDLRWHYAVPLCPDTGVDCRLISGVQPSLCGNVRLRQQYGYTVLRVAAVRSTAVGLIEVYVRKSYLVRCKLICIQTHNDFPPNISSNFFFAYGLRLSAAGTTVGFPGGFTM